jgi:hypothetical protein
MGSQMMAHEGAPLPAAVAIQVPPPLAHAVTCHQTLELRDDRGNGAWKYGLVHSSMRPPPERLTRPLVQGVAHVDGCQRRWWYWRRHP